jgi:acyl-CoA thioester hydrolase
MTRIPIAIRFSDVDFAGHVHNAVYLQYFEAARIALLDGITGRNWNWRKHGLVLARNEVDYRRPVHFRDNLVAEAFVVSVGNSSFVLGYRVIRITEQGEELCAEGKSVMVCFDFEERSTIPAPDLLKSGLEKLIG